MQKEKNNNKPTDKKQDVKFSEADIKKALKARSKGELVKIVVDLSERVDMHIEHNLKIRRKTICINEEKGAFESVQDFSDLLDCIDEKVN